MDKADFSKWAGVSKSKSSTNISSKSIEKKKKTILVFLQTTLFKHFLQMMLHSQSFLFARNKEPVKGF